MNLASPKFKQRFGPWAVVTGASDGIGQEFARELARAGLHLVLTARRARPLQALADELIQTHGVACRVIRADLSDHLAARSLFSATQDLDVGLLVACAGYGTSGPLLHASLDDECAMVAVNCTSVLSMSTLYAQRFAARGGGGLVLMSSVLAFQGVPRAANYAATKAYVQSLAEGLRSELKPLDVDVVSCAPGPIDSGFASRARMLAPTSQPPKAVARATLQALGRQTTVRPGWLSKLLGWSLATLPRSGRVLIMTGIMKGMTAHQTHR